MLDLQQLHELIIQLLMHQSPDGVPRMLDIVELLERKYLLILVVVKCLVDPRSLDDVLLPVVLRLVIVVFNDVSLFVVLVIEVPHSVGKAALLGREDAKASKVKPAKGLLGWWQLTLIHLLLNSLITLTIKKTAIFLKPAKEDSNQY